MILGLLDRFTLRLSAFLQLLELRFGLSIAGLVISTLLLLLAGLYTAPAAELINHGVDYSELARAPFDLSAGNRFQNRVLTPFIGYLTFLRGPLFYALPLLMALGFLTSIYVHLRKTGTDEVAAFGICTMVAFSSTILFTIHFAGYVDTTSYLLLFLCFVFRGRPFLLFVCYSLALMNHESNVFALPCLILLSGYQSKLSPPLLFKSGLALILALLPFLAIRHWFGEGTTHLQFDFYLNKSNLADSIWLQRDNLFYGVFQAFKLFWAVPIVAALLCLFKKRYYAAILIGTIVGCAGLQLFVAADTSRLIGVAFVAVIVGALEIRKAVEPIHFTRILWVLVLANLVLPQAFVGYGTVIPFFSLPVSLYMKYYLGNDVWETSWI